MKAQMTKIKRNDYTDNGKYVETGLKPVLRNNIETGHRPVSTAMLISLFLLLSSFVFAGTGSSGTDLPVFSLGVGARPLGMGGTFIGIADDGNAGYWNPAGLGQLQKREITSMHTKLMMGSSFYYLSYAHPVIGVGETPTPTSGETGVSSVGDALDSADVPIRRLRGNDNTGLDIGTFGISWMQLSSAGIERTEIRKDSNGNIVYDANGMAVIDRLGTYDLVDNGFMLSYGRDIIFGLAVGVSVKVILREMGGIDRGLGIGGDFGLFYRPLKDFGLTIGIVGQDIGGMVIRWSSGGNDVIIPNVKVGLSYRHTLFGNTIGIGIDAVQKIKKEYKTVLHFGGEWIILDVISLRAGMDDMNFTAGAGFKIDPVSVDYAYVTNPEFENTHRISLGARF